MKLLSFTFLLAATLVLIPSRLPAQSDDDSNPDTPAPAGSTVIHSDELHVDQQSHVSVFTGKVIVTGTNFRMTCQEMTVYSTDDNKVSKIVATGDVIITQPDRVTHCGHAEYMKDIDTFILTDQPVIRDHKSETRGTRITIDRASQKMTTDGGRTTIILQDESLGAPATPGSALPTK
jgi:lipopolysaccharide transport protein LptA